LLRTISLGRLKKDLPEVQALLPTRNKAEEAVIVDWNEDPHAVFVYKTIRDASLKVFLFVFASFFAENNPQGFGCCQQCGAEKTG
jgi:hypothetical protein